MMTETIVMKLNDLTVAVVVEGGKVGRGDTPRLVFRASSSPCPAPVLPASPGHRNPPGATAHAHHSALHTIPAAT